MLNLSRRSQMPTWISISGTRQTKDDCFRHGSNQLTRNLHPCWSTNGVRVSYYLSCLMTKPTKWHVRPANTWISLGICPVWSESSLTAWRNFGSLATHCAHSKAWSDWADAQADLSLRWAHTLFCWFHHAAHYPKFTVVLSNSNKIKSSNKVSGIAHSSGLKYRSIKLWRAFLIRCLNDFGGS